MTTQVTRSYLDSKMKTDQKAKEEKEEKRKM